MSVYTYAMLYSSKVGSDTVISFLKTPFLHNFDIVVQGKGHPQTWVPFVFGGIMAGPNARRLYDSKAWQDTRKAYTQSVGGLCERCMANGIVTPAEVVHHKQPLTEDNVDNMDIALSWNNLQALCRKCHADVHDEMYRQRTGRRYKIDENGRVIIV